MGTNFYWLIGSDNDGGSERGHIGKRSAAGQYCYDCDVTLCKAGKANVHSAGSARSSSFEELLASHRRDWYDRCPRCGQAPTRETPGNPAMVELGFERPRQVRPTGVQGASSFTWALPPEEVGWVCRSAPDAPVVRDEYGRTLTGQEFLDMLAACCPLQYTHMIGREFS